MNVVNIACSAPNCSNPVIGQCTGYKKHCRRYYCHIHSSDTLCFNCANQKVADEQAETEQKIAKERAELIYQEYLSLAKKVSQEPIVVGEYKYSLENVLRLVKFFFVIGLIILVIIFLYAGLMYLGGMAELTEAPGVVISRMMIASLVFLFGLPLIFIPLDWYSNKSNWFEKQKKKQILDRVSAIESEKRGFTEFWNTWLKQQKEERAEKSRQALMGVLAVVGVIAVGAIASSLNESDYDRTRRAVRDELNNK